MTIMNYHTDAVFVCPKPGITCPSVSQVVALGDVPSVSLL